MKSKINKITKAVAIGIFFMALFFNVKVSLEDPFIKIDNAVMAQTSSGNCTSPNADNCPGGACSYEGYFGGQTQSCCTACCPGLLRSRCDSSGCQCV